MEKKEFESATTHEKISRYTLDNELTLYFCKKEKFKECVGMLGTKYGSIDFDFVSNKSEQRIQVEDGIAHFLEHKLFEQEDSNALDLFARMGVSSNAYTSFDHTVYFFETNKDFDKCLETLFSFVSSPYFTDENVEKEKGIIEQELKMYQDEPQSVVYYNLLKDMYKNIHLNVDVGGTPESIRKITKERLYDCYETFYNPKNMFCIIIGDVDEDKVIKRANELSNEYIKNKPRQVIRYNEEEPKEVVENMSVKMMPVATNYICIGFKHGGKNGKDNAKNSAIVDILSEAMFGKMSDFYEEIYKENIVNEPIQISYEAGNDFAHTVLYISSEKEKEVVDKVIKYIEESKINGIDKDLCELAKKKIIGDKIFETEEIMSVHRDVIDAIMDKSDIFEYDNELKSITKEDIDMFIKEEINMNYMSISKVLK